MKESRREERPVLVVRADTRDPAHSGSGAGGEDLRRPDFDLIRNQLDARTVDLNDVESSRVGRLVRSVAGTYAALAVVAFRGRRTAAAFVTGSENEAIVLAFLLKLSRRRIPLVVPSIYPSKPVKSPAWRWARVHDYMHRIMPLGTAQADRLINGLGVPPEKVEVLPYGIDTAYWSPEKAGARGSGRPYVFAAGLQHRDYKTLLAATEGLGVDLVVAASSLWSKSSDELRSETLPSWVTVGSLTYRQLRDAYAGAVAVVAPLVETDFPSGTTSIVEAMSMGRPVVATRVEGAGDYIADRRKVLRRGPVRSTSAGFGARFASRSAQGQTGFMFPPGNVEELRSILRWILDHPLEAEAVGARARRVVEEVHSLEGYVGKIVAAVEDGMTDAGAGSPTGRFVGPGGVGRATASPM